MIFLLINDSGGKGCTQRPLKLSKKRYHTLSGNGYVQIASLNFFLKTYGISQH